MADKANTQVWVSKEDRKLFNNLHKGMGSLYTSKGFFRKMLEFYQEYHCPECGERTAVKKACACKASERT